MKLQSLAVIFVIIILPVSLVMSEYIQLQLDSVVLMSQYDAKLNDATYDAIRAYQLNEQNSTTDRIANEKVRDIEASVQTFYASLSNALGTEGYTEEDLKPYVPAIVYTLYDGYYIYGPYYKRTDLTDPTTAELTYGVKPFIAYSEKYEEGSNSIIINYTLDNYITVYGTLNGEPIHKGGYLIDKSKITINNNNTVTLNDKGVVIGQEDLSEISGYDVYADSDDVPVTSERTFKYVNQRTRGDVYYKDGTIRSRQKVIRADDGWYQYNINKTYSKYSFADDSIVPDEEQTDLENNNQDKSALLYYYSAVDFSDWAKTNLSWVKDNNNKYLFSDLRDIEDVDSNFNAHRRDVIRKSIESNLKASIEAYNEISTVAGVTDTFQMPKLTEQDWEKVLNNVSVISFLQNVITKNNYQKYSGYCVLTNNKNKDYIDPSQIYIKENNTLHNISCESLQTATNVVGYKNTDFLRQNIFSGNGISKFYYLHNAELCYDCLVNSQGTDSTNVENALTSASQEVKKAYYEALAREKYNANMAYKVWYDEYTFTIDVTNTGSYWKVSTDDLGFTISSVEYIDTTGSWKPITGTTIPDSAVPNRFRVKAYATKNGKNYTSVIKEVDK